MNTSLKNPYVGPRTFQREDGEFFFGREREARDLMALASSERLILFYAQSGAGKSSLLNTRLLPELEAGNFEVLPVARVQGELPAGMEVENIYVYNLMSSMVQQKFAPTSLTGVSISQFLAVLEFNEGGYILSEESLADIAHEARWPRVLIIDQFEEIFTTHLDAWNKRDDFFQQLAQAMQDDPYLTVILIMREDYIASLDPYAHLLPGGLRMRYYMQRLRREAALRAIKNPVEEVRPYANGVAEKLVDDLASINVQKPDGSLENQSGQYIEPVQLQVVCYGLWEDLPPGAEEITADHILEIGDVDQSLERFYDRRMSTAAHQNNVSERVIREWFGAELITANRTRNMVLQNKNHGSALIDDVIQSMKGDLIRAELRAGQIWYELSHDRLIKPVITSNARWFDEHLSAFQRQVVLWLQQGRSDSLLLSGQELVDAERDAATLTLTTEEQEFLDECRILQKRLQRDRNTRRGLIGLLIIAIAFAIFAGISLRKANSAEAAAVSNANAASTAEAAAVSNANAASTAQANAVSNANAASTAQANAEKQASIALSGSLAAQANSLNNNDHALALLLGVEAYKREQSLLTKKTLFDLLQFTAYEKTVPFNGVVNSVAVSENGELIAIASCTKDDCSRRGEIQIFDAGMGKLGTPISDEFGIVYSLAFHQYDDQLILAAGGCVIEGCSAGKGQITLWEIDDSGDAQLLTQRSVHTGRVKTLAFSLDGKYLASGSYDTKILLWDMTNPGNPKQVGSPLDHASFVNSVSFSPDGNYLVSAGDDRTIYVWNILQQEPQPIRYKEGHTVPVSSVAFSPDGTKLASAGDDNLIILWDWDSGALSNPSKITGHTGYVKTIAFNADGSMLASAGFDNTILLWDVKTEEQSGPPLTVHTKAINAVIFGSFVKDGIDQPYLISVSNDQTAIRWDLFTRNPLSQLLNYEDSVNADEWLEKACEAAKRNLTQEEWITYLPTQTQAYEKTCEEYE